MKQHSWTNFVSELKAQTEDPNVAVDERLEHIVNVMKEDGWKNAPECKQHIQRRWNVSDHAKTKRDFALHCPGSREVANGPRGRSLCDRRRRRWAALICPFRPGPVAWSLERAGFVARAQHAARHARWLVAATCMAVVVVRGF